MGFDLIDIPPVVEDGWANSLKGLGTLSGASRTTTFTAGSQLAIQTFADLADDDWLADRIVSLLPSDALRLPPDGVEPGVWLAYNQLGLDQTLLRGLRQGRACGGAVILLGYDVGEPAAVAPPVGRGTLLWADACPWDWLSVESWEQDANSPWFGWPAVVRVGGNHRRNGLRIHLTRCILCEGKERLRPMRGDATPWLSVLQAVYDTMAQYGLSWESASLLLSEASVGVLKMRGLVQLLSQKNQAVVEARMRLMNEGRSSAHTVFLDSEGDESYERVDVDFTQIPQMLDQWTSRIAAAAEIPVSRLFGRQPGGLGNTGEADLRMWYDTVERYRAQVLAPKQGRLLSILAGQDLDLSYPKLYQLTGLEAAEARLKHAQADKLWWDLSVLESGEIRESRQLDETLGVTLAQPAP